MCNYPLDSSPNTHDDPFIEINQLEDKEKLVEEILNSADNLPHLPFVDVFFNIFRFILILLMIIYYN